MLKRSSANHSLWPEQARPRRGKPLSFAAGGFAVGIICAFAVVNVAFQYVPPIVAIVNVVGLAGDAKSGDPLTRCAMLANCCGRCSSACSDRGRRQNTRNPVAAASPTQSTIDKGGRCQHAASLKGAFEHI